MKYNIKRQQAEQYHCNILIGLNVDHASAGPEKIIVRHILCGLAIHVC